MLFLLLTTFNRYHFHYMGFDLEADANGRWPFKSDEDQIHAAKMGQHTIGGERIIEG